MNSLLLSALIAVESHGNPKAIGDRGKAVGILQIHAGVVDDVNRVYHTHYRWPEDCFDPAKSRAICRQYISIYYGGSDPEVIARLWNGGPRGIRSRATVSYWNRVRKHL